MVQLIKKTEFITLSFIFEIYVYNYFRYLGFYHDLSQHTYFGIDLIFDVTIKDLLQYQNVEICSLGM